MTTPGGVPNLPPGSLTIDNLASSLQDVSQPAMKARAADRFSSIFSGSTGLSPASDITPNGILTTLFSGFNSAVANADPADINGPEDLPGLLINFIEDLPVVGQFVGILEAIVGTYDGDDQILLQVQEIFAPIRKFLSLFTGGGDGFPSLDDVSPENILNSVLGWIKQFTGIDLSNVFDGINLSSPGAVLKAIQSAIGELVGGIIQKIIDAVVGTINGSGSTGNDPLSMVLSLFNPFNLLANLGKSLASVSASMQALVAGLDGRVTAVETNVGTIAAATTTTTGSGMDNFNRASIGSKWTNIVGTLAVQNFGDGFVRTAALAAGYYNAGNPTTDKHGVTIRLTAKAAGVTRAAICSDSTMSNYAALEVYAGQYGDDYLRIVTGSSPGTVLARKQMDFNQYALQNNTVVSLRYDPTANTYHLFKDGTDILQWVDDTNFVTHGSTKRLCPIVSNAGNGNPAYGFAITDFTYYDWT